MVAYITGTSSGIGKSLALKLMKEGHQVIGISRTCTIELSNYEHIFLDLTDLNEVAKFEFYTDIDNDVILINNAGTIGPIKPIGHQIESDIITLNNINITAPQILCNKFIHKFQPLNKQYQILNISSGAGKHPVDAWATYCASKSAIDLFSETIAQELKDRQFNNWHIFSIAPGVVDTKIQTQIRASNSKEFLVKSKFLDLKANNQLNSSKFVANQLFNVLDNPIKHAKTIFSLKDLA